MDLQTLLNGYRVKYGLEAQEAKGTPTLGQSDPFNPTPMDTQPTDQWQPIETPDPQGAMSSPTRLPDEERLYKFAEMADNDPILGKGLDKSDAAIMELKAMVADPNNPMSLDMAIELLNQLEDEEDL